MSSIRSGRNQMISRFTAILAVLFLLAAALACNLPINGGNEQGYDAIATAAQQTVAAQFAAATVSAALGQSAGATQTVLAAGQPTQTQAAQSTNIAQATAMAQSAQTTVQAAQSTTQAGSAQATAAAMESATTAQAQSAQATALWLAATQTAQSWPAQPPPPPFPPPLAPDRIMIPIQFERGATSAYREGGLVKNSVVDYTVKAGQGQLLMVDVTSPNNNVYLGIDGMKDGVLLLSTAAGSTHFQGVLPSTQTYHLTLYSPNQKTTYGLNVIIPARIQFPPGAIAAGVPGYVGPNQSNYYTAWAKAGQTMTVNIASPGNSVLLTVYGLQDGQPLVRSVSGATSWSGVLPGSQDYMIVAVSSGPAANYTLEVMIK